MKTEKRLTMALSVLVALMMLAVPLASSSNLFVDGGQTNSNGDAPSLGAADTSSVSKYTWDTNAKDQIINAFIIDSKASYDMFISKYGLTETNYGGKDRALTEWKADPWLAIIYQTKTALSSLELSISNSNIAKGLNETQNEYTLSSVDGKATITKSVSNGTTNNAIVVSLGADDLKISTDKFQGDYRVTLKVNGTTLSDLVTYTGPNDVKIIDSWIVYDQTSLDKIGNYVGKDIQNSNFGEKWNGTAAWIAIAYTAPAGVGSVDFTAKFGGSEKTLTTSVGDSNGTHVFAAYVNGTHANEDCFGLTVGTGNYPTNYYGKYSVNVAGANTSYDFAFGSSGDERITITFNLNVPDSEGRISLDEVKANLTKITGVEFSYDPDNKNLVYAKMSKNSIQIANVLGAINPTKAGYNFISWTDENGVQSDSSRTDMFEKSVTLNANWEIEDGWVQVPIDVVYDGTTYKYSLAMASTDGKTVNISSLNIIDLLPDEINDKGYIINLNDEKPSDTPVLGAAALDTVYTYTVNENNADGKDLKSNGLVSMNSSSSVFIQYSLTSYTKITVLCDIFGEEKAVMYAYNSNNYTYKQVWDALKSATAEELGLKKSFGGTGSAALNTKIVDGKILTADEKYRILNWDSNVALDDTKTVPGVELRLNVELNGYNVIFMVNGQAQVVNIPYNQLSVEKCPFDVTGVNHWVYMTYENYSKGIINNSTLMPFSFNSQSNIKTVNDTIATDETPTFVFIACFERADNTAYAVFNASSNGIAGNYGNEYITSIIIPGKAVSGNNSTVILLPAVQPVYESKNVLIGYVDSDGKAYANTGDDASKYGVKDSVKVFDANVIPYKYTITFYNGSDVNGIFYYSGDSQTSNNSITTGLVAFSYNGVAYEYKATLAKDVSKAFNSILYPTKDGYKVTQWKDADGNVMLDKVDKNATSGIVSYEVKFKKISSDMNFYANFEAKEYTIVYSGNTATSTNTMEQDVKVDQNVNLFSDSTFSNDGFKLKEWNTRPDGKGTSYALGASFALNGEQFEDLKNGEFTLYAIWEKSSSGSGSGDNNEGNDGNNTDTYLLAGILAVIIILIILIAFLMKRKQ